MTVSTGPDHDGVPVDEPSVGSDGVPPERVRKRKKRPDITLYQSGRGPETERILQQYRTNLSINVKRLRTLHKLSQRELATIMVATQGHVGSVELGNGGTIGMDTLTRFGVAFGVDPLSLLMPATEAEDDGHVIEAVKETSRDQALLDLASITQARSTTTDQPPPADILPTSKPVPPPSTPVPELLLNVVASGVSLTFVKRIVMTVYKRLEALERRHGAETMTREMLTSLLVAALGASQNIDDEESSQN